ncbi:MAG: sigma-70 family RNA polymerase sigma factor [Syntrophorhabdales bacterium]|jgi:RNA polymerase sigma-32 factor
MTPVEAADLTRGGPVSDLSETVDSFKRYLGEIAKHPLLTKEEEKEIAERIRRYNDKKAEEKLIVANLRLVVKIALQYSRYCPNTLDFIQEGNVGLLHAVRKYDPDRGTRFSTYASFWVRAYILKHLMDSWSMVKIGTKDAYRKLFFSLNKERGEVEKSGMTATPEVLAEHLSVSASDVEEMERRLCNGDVSLEAPMNEGGEHLIDTLGTDEDIEETVAEMDDRAALQTRVSEFKKALNEKERYILENRIMAEDPMTLQEIGDFFHTSRESVRQIQVRISRNLARNLKSSRIWS